MFVFSEFPNAKQYPALDSRDPGIMICTAEEKFYNTKTSATVACFNPTPPSRT